MQHDALVLYPSMVLQLWLVFR